MLVILIIFGKSFAFKKKKKKKKIAVILGGLGWRVVLGWTEAGLYGMVY